MAHDDAMTNRSKGATNMTTDTREVEVFPQPEELEATRIYILESPHTCPVHGVRHLVTCPLEGLRSYNMGAYIQDPTALGCLTSGRREVLMSGICEEAWDTMMGEEAWDTLVDGEED